jgi:hypothetical protein
MIKSSCEQQELPFCFYNHDDVVLEQKQGLVRNPTRILSSNHPPTVQTDGDVP